MFAVYDCEKRCSLHEPFFYPPPIARRTHYTRVYLVSPAERLVMSHYRIPSRTVCLSVRLSFFPAHCARVRVSVTAAVSLYRRHWCRETRRAGDVNLTGLSRRKSVYCAALRSRFSPVRFYLPSTTLVPSHARSVHISRSRLFYFFKLRVCVSRRRRNRITANDSRARLRYSRQIHRHTRT